MPTHFTNGVSNRPAPHTLTEWGYLDPTKHYTYFTDFHTWYPADWTITTTEVAGTADEIIADAAGGVLQITNGTADNDNDLLQLAKETFKWVSGKEMWFYTRFKVSDATESDLAIGLQIRDTSPLDTTDGFFFIKADGSTTLNFLVEKNNTATTTAVGTLAADTYVTVGFHYNPKTGLFHIYLNDVQVATSVATNACDDEELAVSIGIQNGEAAAKVLSVDFILASVER
jgi:hypothetical protein